MRSRLGAAAILLLTAATRPRRGRAVRQDDSVPALGRREARLDLPEVHDPERRGPQLPQRGRHREGALEGSQRPLLALVGVPRRQPRHRRLQDPLLGRGARQGRQGPQVRATGATPWTPERSTTTIRVSGRMRTLDVADAPKVRDPRRDRSEVARPTRTARDAAASRHRRRALGVLAISRRRPGGLPPGPADAERARPPRRRGAPHGGADRQGQAALRRLARRREGPALLLLPASASASARAHLARFAVFQKVSVEDATERVRGVAPLRRRAGVARACRPASCVLPAEAEMSGGLLARGRGRAARHRGARGRRGRGRLGEAEAEVLRVEAGRARFGVDADDSNLPDEVGLQDAISTDKGCYVGQEIVARLRTYGRVSRRLVGFRFPDGRIAPGTVFPDPGKPDHAARARHERGRFAAIRTDRPRFRGARRRRRRRRSSAPGAGGARGRGRPAVRVTAGAGRAAGGRCMPRSWAPRWGSPSFRSSARSSWPTIPALPVRGLCA